MDLQLNYNSIELRILTFCGVSALTREMAHKASAGLMCAGCRTTITHRQYLRCSLCALIYDLECANVSEARFLNTMTKDRKATWKCIHCVSKQPKTGNLNTPVGAAQSSGQRNENRTQNKNKINIEPLQLDHSPGAANGRETPPAVNNPDLPRSADMPAISTVHTSPECNSTGHIALFGGTGEENVTIRRGGGVTGEGNAEYTYSEDIFCMDSIRATIRDEFERFLEERLSVVIAKQISEQITAPMKKSIHDLSERVLLLEDKIKILEGGKQTTNSKKPTKSNQYEHGDTVTQNLPLNNKTAPLSAEEVDQGRVADQSKTNVFTDNKQVSASHKSNSQHDPVEWTEVVKKRSRVSPVGVIRGAAAPGAMKLEAAERRRYLHLYYVKVGTTEEQVRDHLRAICPGDDSVVIVLKARGNYASFKLDVPSKSADTIMSPENWPEDVCVKPWSQSPYRSFRHKSEEQKS